MTRHVVATVDEVPPGGRKLVRVGGSDVALFNVAGRYFAILDRCPHAGGSLCKGKLIGLVESTGPGEYLYSRQGEIIRCAWHGWEFDLRTGRSRCDPQRLRALRYDASVAGGSELAQDPHIVQTFSVRVEADYVVIDA